MSYTCTDYRIEMMLLSLKRQAADENLSHSERETLEMQIRDLEKTLGIEDS
ncbi:MAG: hypothetical protein V2L15_04050 [Desulfobacteraceae bacterium]|jgi:hypothetical protein|nr:hypothetical protein [Desulfobacteraceae bacterium]